MSSAELACVAPLPEEQQWNKLRSIRKGKGYKSYWDGIRSNEAEIFTAAGSLFEIESPTDEQIRQCVEETCLTNQERRDNVEVLLGLRKYIAFNKITARHYNFGKLAIHIGGSVTYWSNLLIRMQGRTYVPLIDPRKTETKLTPLGVRFAMSMQDTHIRAPNPTEFGNVGLLVIQFRDAVEEGAREAIPTFEDGAPLWKLSELQVMIERTYRIWEAVLQERAAKRRAA